MHFLVHAAGDIQILSSDMLTVHRDIDPPPRAQHQLFSALQYTARDFFSFVV